MLATMPKQTAVVDYEVCRPERCAPEDGLCAAARACRRNLLVQEQAYEAPFVFPADMCQGCSDCIRACPLDAIRLG